MKDAFDQRALAAHLSTLEASIAGAPAHILHKIRREQEIDAHNTAVEQKKMRRQNLREVSKRSRVPVEVLKRVLAKKA